MSKLLLPLTIRQAEHLNEALCCYLITKGMCAVSPFEDEEEEEMEELETVQKMLADIINGIDFVENHTSEVYEEEI